MFASGHSLPRMLPQTHSRGVVIPHLQGGLGNQLFQIAHAYETAQRMGAQLMLDFSLPWFAGQGLPPATYADTFYRRIHKGQVPGNHSVVLRGYWQDPSYWSNPAEIRELFRFWTPERHPDLCAIHIRGGDYENQRHLYPEILGEWYRRQMLNAPGEWVKVFTDDTAYARTILPEMEMETGDAFVEMANARSLVMANSTYSWWAAFLGEIPCVLPPPVWTANAPMPWLP